MARTFSPVANGHLAVLHVMNVSPMPLTIHQGTILGEYTLLAELMLINSTISTHLLPPIESTLCAVDLSQCNLPPAQKQKLLDLLHDYGDLFTIDGGPLG